MEIVKNWEATIEICSECYRECAGDSVCEDCKNAIMQEIYAEIARQQTGALRGPYIF